MARSLSLPRLVEITSYSFEAQDEQAALSELETQRGWDELFDGMQRAELERWQNETGNGRTIRFSLAPSHDELDWR